MSWMVSFIGTAENISAALDNYSKTCSADIKKEFDAGLPHLKAILALNYASPGYSPSAYKLVASGSAWKGTTGEYSNYSVTLEPITGKVV